MEGLHALKHALRFGAEVVCVAITEPERLHALAGALAPDVLARMPADTQTLSPEAFRALAPQPPPTGVIALARRPPYTIEEMLHDARRRADRAAGAPARPRQPRRVRARRGRR